MNCRFLITASIDFSTKEEVLVKQEAAKQINDHNGEANDEHKQRQVSTPVAEARTMSKDTLNGRSTELSSAAMDII